MAEPVNRTHSHLARLMAFVAFVAVDCGLVRLILSKGDELGAISSVGLTVSLVLIGLLLTRGRLGRFGAGFVATTLLVAIMMAAVLSGLHPRLGELWNDYFNTVIRALPPPLADDSTWQPVDAAGIPRPGLTAKGAQVAVWVVAVPLFALGLVGGLIALVVPRRSGSTHAPHPNPT